MLLSKRIFLSAFFFFVLSSFQSTVYAESLLDCSDAYASKESIGKANNKMKKIKILGVVGANKIRIQCISQDEPLGNWEFDASGIGKKNAKIRRSRSDEGNGRVYHIDFVATSAQGEQCSGTVNVSVPLKKKQIAIDDGRLFNSTGSDVACSEEPDDSTPKIVSTPVTEVREGQTYSYEVVTAYSEIEELTYILNEAPQGMNIDYWSGFISWEPDYETAGDHSIEVLVRDGLGAEDTQRFTLVVENTNRLPIATALTLETDSKTELPITLAGSDSDQDELSYFVVTEPNNGTVTGTGNARSYIPNPTFGGTDFFEYLVNDGTSDSEKVTVTINVLHINSSPTISITTPESELSIEENSTIDLIASALDEEDGDVSENIRWVSNLDGEIGSGASISTQLSIGEHSIKAIVLDSVNTESVAEIIVYVVPQSGDSLISLSVSSNDIQMIPNSEETIVTTLNVTNIGPDKTVSVTQEFVALWGNIENLTLTSAISDTFVFSSSEERVYSQDISSLKRGLYEIVTTAEIIETGDTVTTITRVSTVLNNPTVLDLSEPASSPGVLPKNETTSVVFSVKTRSSNKSTPINLSLVGDLELPLNDNGVDGDVRSGDGVFSGTITVDGSEYGLDDCLTVSAIAHQDQLTTTSDEMSLCFSDLPIKFASSNTLPSNIIEDTNSGSKVIADEIIIKMYEEYSSNKVKTIAASVNAEVVGGMPDLNVYQLRFSDRFEDLAQLNHVIGNVMLNGEVYAADRRAIGSLASTRDSAELAEKTLPNDPMVESYQSYLEVINAPQAWTLAIGSETIAVIDSGIIQEHDDLASKIIPGRNYVETETLEDENGHGTHVAGIAAAHTDNNEGMAGISWESPILVIKAYNRLKLGDPAIAAEAIRYAVNHGARIINISAADDDGQIELCSAVAYARKKGSIVVAAAGNDGQTDNYYPGACKGAVAVGNTTDNDQRYVTSNHGSWLDLAAPGVEVWSADIEFEYAPFSGTSESAAMVSGALAVVMDRVPGISSSEAINRLKDTAVPLPGQGLGAGRIDLYEAMFPAEIIRGTLKATNVTMDENGDAIVEIKNLPQLEGVGLDVSNSSLRFTCDGNIRPVDFEVISDISTITDGESIFIKNRKGCQTINISLRGYIDEYLYIATGGYEISGYSNYYHPVTISIRDSVGGIGNINRHQSASITEYAFHSNFPKTSTYTQNTPIVEGGTKVVTEGLPFTIPGYASYDNATKTEYVNYADKHPHCIDGCPTHLLTGAVWSNIGVRSGMLDEGFSAVPVNFEEYLEPIWYPDEGFQGQPQDSWVSSIYQSVLAEIPHSIKEYRWSVTMPPTYYATGARVEYEVRIITDKQPKILQTW